MIQLFYKDEIKIESQTSLNSFNVQIYNGIGDFAKRIEAF